VGPGDFSPLDFHALAAAFVIQILGMIGFKIRIQEIAVDRHFK